MSRRVDDDGAFAEWFVEGVMRDHLVDDYYGISDRCKREMVLNARALAHSLGFDRNEDQAQFVLFMWLIGPDFYTKPGFREVLQDQSRAPGDRLQACYDVPTEQATQAIQTADQLFWYPDMVKRREEMQG